MAECDRITPVSDMIFSPHESVMRLSQDMALVPGDLIICATSLGVLPMKPGCTIEIQINGIGTLQNSYVAANKESLTELCFVKKADLTNLTTTMTFIYI